MADTRDCILFYNSEDVKSNPRRRRIRFPMVIRSEDYHRLRHDLDYEDLCLQLSVYIHQDERKLEEDNKRLNLKAFGRRYLKTEAVTYGSMIAFVGREYFYDLYETNNDPNLLAFVGVREGPQ